MYDAILTTLCETRLNLIIHIKNKNKIIIMIIRQCVRINGMSPNESRDLFNVAYELMCV